MGRIAVLLADVPATRGLNGRECLRNRLTREQWDEILAAYERGVTAPAIFARLSGAGLPWFYVTPKQLANGIMAERKDRIKRVS